MTDPVAVHEDLTREHDADEASPRSFGLLFFVVFLIIGLAPMISGGSVRWWGAGVAAVFGGVAWVAPQALAPLSALWMRFGSLLHCIVSPVVMAALFLGAVLPTGLLMRLVGRDSLSLKRDRTKTTYWVDRTPPGPEPESLRQQF